MRIYKCLLNFLPQAVVIHGLPFFCHLTIAIDTIATRKQNMNIKATIFSLI